MNYIEELTNEYDDIKDIIKVVEGSTRTEPKEDKDDLETNGELRL